MEDAAPAAEEAGATGVVEEVKEKVKETVVEPVEGLVEKVKDLVVGGE
jgi:hypothetical protein